MCACADRHESLTISVSCVTESGIRDAFLMEIFTCVKKKGCFSYSYCYFFVILELISVSMKTKERSLFELNKLIGVCNPLLTNRLLVVRGSEGALCTEEG